MPSQADLFDTTLKIGLRLTKYGFHDMVFLIWHTIIGLLRDSIHMALQSKDIATFYLKNMKSDFMKVKFIVVQYFLIK